MIKKILIAFFLLIIIGVVAAYFSINAVVGGGITKVFNKLGPEITGTKTYVESTSVNVFDGDIGINGLFIGNPEGFDKPSAMECGEIFIDIEPGSLFSDQIVINEIRIIAPKFTFESTLTSNNLTKLKSQIDANTKKYTSEKQPPPPPGEEPSPTAEASKKTLLLHKIIVTDGNVDLAVLKIEKTLPLPQIQKDFGGEGVTPAQAADYVLSVVLEKVVEVAAQLVREISNDPNAILKSITGGDGASAVDSAGEAIKGLFD
ncbi:hypothetical protein [Cerasicoccus arenae]|uniref:AsmA domain-containing protein n=1 Tax=Cerasicoccus arenae TaxID=424488 RepID=A0A8J3GG10_9BACT|nr:hypothetical protein [Cerasicoccus arenae]MBK1858377.1 hypothetical protein [Cerasicoccus arenae]GHC09896.1 hypothetical protein GCM10007047_29060 [Cerasicoccus arenae]